MKKILKQPDSKFFKCACSAHAVHVMSYNDEDETYLSIWECGANNGRLSLWERLRYAFKILKDGKPYEDEVVLDKETALSFAAYLSSCASRKTDKMKAKRSILRY